MVSANDINTKINVISTLVKLKLSCRFSPCGTQHVAHDYFGVEWHAAVQTFVTIDYERDDGCKEILYGEYGLFAH